MAELELAEEWVNEELGTRKQWAKTVRDKVWERETEKWRKEMDTKVKLERYRAMKTELKFEQYLTCDCSRYDIANYVQWRGGVAKLRIETGRWVNLKREDRVCELCSTGEVEDERHMIVRCEKRKEMREELEREREERESLVRREW